MTPPWAGMSPDIVDDRDEEWIDEWSEPEVEIEDEQQQSYEQDLMNLRVLEWLNGMTSDPKETSVTIQDIDRESMKYIKTETYDSSWALLMPASNFDLISGMRSAGTSMDIFVRGSGGRRKIINSKIKNSKRKVI